MLNNIFGRKKSVAEEPGQSHPIERQSRPVKPVFTGADCERCGATGTRIVYGLPAPGSDLEDQAGRGEIVFGGCVVSREQPTHTCSNCGSRWRIDSRLR